MVDRLREEFEGRVEFRLYNLDLDPDASSVADRFDVRYIPTFIFMDSRGNQVDVHVGSLSEDDLRSLLDSLE